MTHPAMMPVRSAARLAPIVLLFLALLCPATPPLAAQDTEWPIYGGDAGGTRFSALAQIHRENVSSLAPAWTFRTGELEIRVESGAPPSLETTPLVIEGRMYLGTPLGRAFAIDPGTGELLWRFDAGVDPTRGYGDFNHRGVTAWLDPDADAGAPCRHRIFLPTVDARLIALDAEDGSPCPGFARNGTLNLRDGLRIHPFEFQGYQLTSPPTVIGDLVVVGSAIADNSHFATASGEIRAFDARTGELRWSFDPIPEDGIAHRGRDPDAMAGTPAPSWGDGSGARTGGGNAWSIIVADPERDLVFVPTSSPAPDYFGGLRPGDNRYANSVVALRGSTGEVVWHFQTVHHDLWDYDNAAPPTLAEARAADGSLVPVVLQATKTGMLFVLHRETGEAVFPVEERPVPPSDIPGEVAWPTQPFTALTPPLSPHQWTAGDAWGPDDAAREACRLQLSELRDGGVFTPPSTQGSLAVPSVIGGAHWGGVAVDPVRGLAIVPVNRIASMVRLIPEESFDADAARETSSRTGDQFTRMRGTGWIMQRRFLLGPAGLPCTPPPFGSLVAVSLDDGGVRWDVPLGTMLLPDGSRGPAEWGSVNLGGAIVTAGGLIFIGATHDRAIRAFDVETGAELWRGELPAGGKATPITYTHEGRQYVVIAAGGGGFFGDGDSIVAFALPMTEER